LNQGFLFQKMLGLFVKTNGWLSRPLFGGLGHIFMLHRVLPESLRNQYTINRDLAITPEYLEECIVYLKSKAYTFISLDEVNEILATGRTPSTKFICLTLDDGYRDNLLYGMPIFEKHGIPVTIYVTNCFPNGTALLWWYMLENVVMKNHAFHLPTPQGTKSYAWKDAAQGTELFGEIRNAIRKLPKTDFRPALLSAFQTTEAQVAEMNHGLFLSWEEIRQLSSSPLVTIGGHTMNHHSLKALSDEELYSEVMDSRMEIAHHISRPVDHFAYPYGGTEDASHREYEAIRAMGFATATLNLPGNVFHVQAAHQECLPRMPLGNRTDHQRLTEIMNGIHHFANNGFSRTFHQH